MGVLSVVFIVTWANEIELNSPGIARHIFTALGRLVDVLRYIFLLSLCSAAARSLPVTRSGLEAERDKLTYKRILT